MAMPEDLTGFDLAQLADDALAIGRIDLMTALTELAYLVMDGLRLEESPALCAGLAAVIDEISEARQRPSCPAPPTLVQLREDARHSRQTPGGWRGLPSPWPRRRGGLESA